MPRPSLNTQILIGCLLGILGGLWLATQSPSAPVVSPTLYGAKMVGNLFLDLLRMVLVPVFVVALFAGGGGLNLIAQEVARLAGVVLAEYAVAARKLKDSRPSKEVADDITGQLQRLVPLAGGQAAC